MTSNDKHLQAMTEQTHGCVTGHNGGTQPKPKCMPPTWQQRIAFFGDLRGFSHPIATASPDAQKLFDQACPLLSILTINL